MRKITLLFFVFTFFITQAQYTTTGEITLTPGFTVQFDVDGPNDTVTMTMVGPSNVWLGVAINSTLPGMGNFGDDVIIFSSSGLKDYHMTGNNVTPNEDTNQWNLIDQDNSIPGVVTIVATRVLDTSESTDYIFSTSIGTIPFLWAKGNNSLNLGWHGSSNRGGAQGTFILSSPYITMEEFEIYPNPTINELNFEFPQNIQFAEVQVYNVLGKQILQETLKKTYPTLNTSSWASGMYVVQIVTDNAVQTKRVVKQ
jgi:hypothetical protein